MKLNLYLAAFDGVFLTFLISFVLVFTSKKELLAVSFPLFSPSTILISFLFPIFLKEAFGVPGDPDFLLTSFLEPIFLKADFLRGVKRLFILVLEVEGRFSLLTDVFGVTVTEDLTLFIWRSRCLATSEVTIRLCLIGLLGTVLAGRLVTAAVPLKFGLTSTLFLIAASKLSFLASSSFSNGSFSLA